MSFYNFVNQMLTKYLLFHSLNQNIFHSYLEEKILVLSILKQLNIDCWWKKVYSLCKIKLQEMRCVPISIVCYYIFTSRNNVRIEKYINGTPANKSKSTRGPYLDYKRALEVYNYECAKLAEIRANAIRNKKRKIIKKNKEENNQKTRQVIIKKTKQEIEKEKEFFAQLSYTKMLLGRTIKDSVFWKKIKSHATQVISEQSFKCNFNNKECLFNVIVINKDDQAITNLDLRCDSKSYVENNKILNEVYKEIVNQQRRHSKPMKSSNRDTRNKKRYIKLKKGDYVVRTNLYQCHYQEHILEQIDAIINVVTKVNNVHEIILPAAYCSSCNCYFILKSDFDRVLNKGAPVCRLIQDVKFYKDYINYDNLRIESVLKENKYNVQKMIGYTDQERQDILANMIDNSVITPIQIISYLKAFIARKEKLPSYQLAVSKWSSDIDFVSAYKKGQNRRVYISSVNYLKYIKSDNN